MDSNYNFLTVIISERDVTVVGQGHPQDKYHKRMESLLGYTNITLKGKHTCNRSPTSNATVLLELQMPDFGDSQRTVKTVESGKSSIGYINAIVTLSGLHIGW